MLQNAYFLAKIGADTAENEQHFAEICQPTLSDVSAASGRGGGAAEARPHQGSDSDSGGESSAKRAKLAKAKAAPEPRDWEASVKAESDGELSEEDQENMCEEMLKGPVLLENQTRSPMADVDPDVGTNVGTDVDPVLTGPLQRIRQRILSRIAARDTLHLENHK